jgi:hypothetical protein
MSTDNPLAYRNQVCGDCGHFEFTPGSKTDGTCRRMPYHPLILPEAAKVLRVANHDAPAFKFACAMPQFAANSKACGEFHRVTLPMVPVENGNIPLEAKQPTSVP